MMCASTSPRPTPRVLVVDDHRKIRDPLAVYLRRHLFEVRTAEDAAGMSFAARTGTLVRRDGQTVRLGAVESRRLDKM